MLESKALALEERRVCPKLKLWIPSVVGVQSFSFGGAAGMSKAKALDSKCCWSPKL